MNTNEDELKNAIINHLTEWFRDLGIETHQIENSADEILALIAQEVHKARVEEVKKLWNATQPDLVPKGWEPNTKAGQVLKKRLAQLKDKGEE